MSSVSRRRKKILNYFYKISLRKQTEIFNQRGHEAVRKYDETDARIFLIIILRRVGRGSKTGGGEGTLVVVVARTRAGSLSLSHSLSLTHTCNLYKQSPSGKNDLLREHVLLRERVLVREHVLSYKQLSSGKSVVEGILECVLFPDKEIGCGFS